LIRATSLRVAFLTHSYPRFSGDAAGSFLLTLAQALVAHDVLVDVLAPAAQGLAAHEVLDGVPVHRFRYAPRSWETLAYTGTMAETVAGSLTGKAALLGYIYAQARTTRALVQRLSIDVVHAHWWFPAGLAATVRARRGRPLVVTMHGSDVRLAARKSWAHPLFRRVMRRAASTTTVSTWLADQARAMAPEARPIVAPMPVNTALFEPGPRDKRAANELLFVGRINEQKGLRVLLEALARARSEARLHVVGDGPDVNPLREYAATLGIAPRLTWHGTLPREKLVPLYQRASAVVVPSVDEGLGLVAVEAQLCETPVVAFASAGLLDVIKHGDTGVLVPAKDVASLAASIDSVLADGALQRSLGIAGRRQALATFSPDAVAAGHAALYRRLVPHAAP
jgi:glycosyltransferase involved in cell wall biosynthesis